MHYNQWNRAVHAKPRIERPPKVVAPKRLLSAEDRYLSRVVKADGCWGWTGHKVGGYGRLIIDGKGVYVHRFSYERYVGPIPNGAEIDHSCHNSECSNPAHLRLATHKQNTENLKGARSNSRTGVRGVTLRANGGYLAKVGHNGRKIYVGVFATLSEADAAASAKRNELFTHNIADRVAT